jgi:organic hydroperoxide reductase OsmC/OhrA
MHPLPHKYRTTSAASAAGGAAILSSPGLPDLTIDAPAEFDGPGDQWSPETLLTGAVADCFVLTFRAIAAASKLEWKTVRCNVESTLERVDNVTRFSRFELKVHLAVPAGTDEARAKRVIEKAERGCMVTNSLVGERHLDAVIEQG